VTPLYLTGRYSGLVISAGASFIEIMPVFEGYPLFQCFKSLPIGTLSLNKFLRDDLTLLNKEISMDFLRSITEEELNEVRNSYGYIGAPNTLISITVRKIRMKFIADKINFNSFFGNPENEEPNIAYSFLSALNQLPSNCFDAISRNIVLAGGFWRIRGMQKLFKKQIKEQLPKFPHL
jgi:actin-related protein